MIPLGLATCVTLRPGEKYHMRPACVPRNEGWKPANGFAGKICLRLLIVDSGENREHRRDAYDTLGLATCVTLRRNEKYHRRPACVPRNEGWKSANGFAGKICLPAFDRRPCRKSGTQARRL
jgi:hypothetical protein